MIFINPLYSDIFSCADTCKSNKDGRIYFKGSQIIFLQLLGVPVSWDCFTSANSVDRDEMLHNVAFRLVFAVGKSTHLGVSS